MTGRGKILACDDTPESLRLLTEMLETEGYEVRPAISAALALHSATGNPPELVLLDIRMPEMDGFEVCRRLKARAETREVPVIFVSATSETGEKVRAFEVGAVDFVTKPYQRDELLARVRTHLELNRLRSHLEELVLERTTDLMESERKLKSSLLDSITALAATVEMRDSYTAGHQQRVAQLAVAIARELHLPDNQVTGIHLASAVHDVGNIRVPVELLGKPGKLSAQEFERIKEHAKAGYEILKPIDFPWPIAQAVLQHHERLDGSGYPQSLRDGQILLEAKVIMVADVVESMMSNRPHRSGLGLEVALAQVVMNKGILFDCAVVDACTRLFRERGFHFSNGVIPR